MQTDSLDSIDCLAKSGWVIYTFVINPLEFNDIINPIKMINQSNMSGGS